MVADNSGADSNVRESIRDTTPNRRDLLKTFGTSSAILLAGCSGGDDTTDGNGDSNPSGGDSPVLTGVITSENPERVNWNRYGTVSNTATNWNHLTHSLAIESHTHAELLPDLGEDWTMTAADEAKITIEDGFTWHDGDDVTAEDVMAKYTLEMLTGQASFDTIEDIEVVDDLTLTLSLERPVNPEGFFINIGSVLIDTKYDVFQEFVDRTWDGEDPGAITADLEEFRVDDPTGFGPWELAESTGSTYAFELYEDHPYADDYTYDRMEMTFVGSASGRWQRLLSDDLSVTEGRPTTSTLDQVSDSYDQYSNYYHWGMGWTWNHDVEPFGRRKARKGIAYALNQTQICRNSGLPESVLHEAPYHNGIFGDEERNRAFIGDLVEDLESYEQDTGEAERLFEEAGLTRDGDSWQTPDGEPVSFRLQVPMGGYDYYIPMAETVVSQLGDFGIEVELQTMESSSFFAAAPEGDFEMMSWFIGGGVWHPQTSLTYLFTPGAISTTVAKGFDLAALEIPMPIGDPDGSVEEVNVLDAIDDMGTADEGTRQEAYRTLAWAANQSLITYEMSEHSNVLFVNSDVWEGPDPDELIAGTQQTVPWTRTGDLQVRE